MDTGIQADRLSQSELVRRLEENWRLTFSVFTALLPQGGVREPGGGLLIKTGLPIAFFNMCFVNEDHPGLQDVVHEAASFFKGFPYTVLVPEGHAELIEICEAAGLRVSDKVPGMALSPIPEQPDTGELEVRSLRSDNLSVYLDVFCEGFGFPREMAAQFVTEDLLKIEAGDHLIGYAGDEPVAVASVFDSGDVAGVYNIATLPDHRGKGYGAAVTWAAIDRARERGRRHAILQSTEMGYPVYGRMGFETVRTYLCYTNDQ